MKHLLRDYSQNSGTAAKAVHLVPRRKWQLTCRSFGEILLKSNQPLQKWLEPAGAPLGEHRQFGTLADRCVELSLGSVPAMLLQQGPTHLLGMARSALGTGEIFRQRLQRHGAFEGLAHRLMVGEDPGVKSLHGNTQRPRYGEAVALLCFIEFGDALVSAVGVSYQDERVEAVTRGVQHRFPGEFEVTAALPGEEVTARQVVDVEPVEDHFRQDA